MQPNAGRARSHSETTAFTVSGRNVLLNGTPFFIKGVDYGNNQIDAYADPNPLDNANEKVWNPDLDAMRAAGVNAVKVYNVSLDSFKPYEDIIGAVNKLRPYESGKINRFLDKAWNGGNHPVYVVLSIFFGGANVMEPKYLNALKAVYNLMANEYAAYPAVMGISIGSEINSRAYINDPTWWKGLNQINNQIWKGYNAVGAEKITTTTMVDDGLRTVKAGELAGFKVDTWGIDVYRGRTMGESGMRFPQARKSRSSSQSMAPAPVTIPSRPPGTTPPRASARTIRPERKIRRCTAFPGRGRGKTSRNFPRAVTPTWTSS